MANYAEAQRAAVKFVETVASGLRDEYDEKSDRWKEGDAGQAAEQFVNSWEYLTEDEPDFVRLDKIMDPHPPEPDRFLAALGELPEESNA